MSETLRVILELGKRGRRIVAGAMDWPGLERWGRTEDEALERLQRYRSRYAAVAGRAGLGDQFASASRVEVVELVPGNSSTDFWGVAHVPSQIEEEVLSAADLERRLDLLQGAWAYFDEVAGRVSEDLRLGPRGGGRSRTEIIHHVFASERHNWSPKVEVRTPPGVMLTPEGLATHRRQYLEAIRAYNAEGRKARRWPIQFLIRRTAQHTMDHAWEMEDRDLNS